MGQKSNLHINIGKLFCLHQEKREPFVFGSELIVASIRSFLSGLCLCRIWNNIIKIYLDFIMRAWLWGISPWRSEHTRPGFNEGRNKRRVFSVCVSVLWRPAVIKYVLFHCTVQPSRIDPLSEEYGWCLYYVVWRLTFVCVQNVNVY